MSKTKLSSREVIALAKEALNIMQVVEEYKKLYQRLDEITALLQGYDLSPQKLVIVDNFAEKNVVFRPAGVRRFELKRVS